MRNPYKIIAMSLILILWAISALPVSAEEMSVLSEQQTALWQGQTSRVYEVMMNCPGSATLTSSPGSQYVVYAQKKARYGSCPSANSIRYNYDKVAYGYSGTASMTLSSGAWCLVVYGYSGSGSYSLRVYSNCATPTPYPTPYPTVYPTVPPTAPPTVSPTPYPTQPGPCGVYKTNSQQGFLNQGQASVYSYLIPTDGRSKIEWSMTSKGSCGGNNPIIVASAGSPSVQASGCSGSSTFDLYVFKDCNPQTSHCSTKYYSYGPNSHASIANPSSGSTYSVMVYARSGSGTFDLIMNSYKCAGGDTPIIVASVGSDSIDSASEVTAPTAEFVTAGSAE